MSDLLDKCKEYFNTDDLYEVLNVKRTATSKEIKKAYYKLSLLVHPDRVEETKKEAATEKFKILGKIHSILQEDDKRKIYDETGDFDDENYLGTNWGDYWRAMFKKISTEDIDKFKNQYIGSDTEIYDIKRAYTNGKGSMDYILEMVPFSNCDDEPRIIEVVKDLIEKEEVEEYACFFNEPKKMQDKRRRKWEKEKKESEKLNISDNDIATQIQKEQEKRAKKMDNFLLQLEAKYAGNGKGAKRKSLKENGEPSMETRSRSTRSKK